MPAYVVFMRDETVDPDELAEYSARADASFEGHEMKLLADYGTIETLEGDEIEGAVILEFPDMAAARAWYRSPEYQATAQHRFRSARYRGFIVAGLQRLSVTSAEGCGPRKYQPLHSEPAFRGQPESRVPSADNQKGKT